MPDNTAQKESPSYRLAALDPDFILGDSTRGVRFMLEYQKAEDHLRARGVVSTIVVFGSARVHEGNPWYEAARAFGRIASERGGALLDGEAGRHHVIATGGGPGIMEAANRGAHETGGASYGLNIILPHEQGANPHVDKSIEFRYFFTRKVCLVKYSCAFIVMPGGLGTLDEMFEAATLIQCRKIGPFPLILMGERFWDGLRTWGQYMMEQGVFAKEELGFGRVTDSPKEAVDLIVRSLPDSVRSQLKPL